MGDVLAWTLLGRARRGKALYEYLTMRRHVVLRRPSGWAVRRRVAALLEVTLYCPYLALLVYLYLDLSDAPPWILKLVRFTDPAWLRHDDVEPDWSGKASKGYYLPT